MMLVAPSRAQADLAALEGAADLALRHGITQTQVNNFSTEQKHRMGADAHLVLRTAAARRATFKRDKAALNPFQTLLRDRAKALEDVSKRDLAVTHPAACRKQAKILVSRRYGADRVVGAAFHRLPPQAKQRVLDDIETEYNRLMEVPFVWSAYATEMMHELRRACVELITDGATRRQVVAKVQQAERLAVTAVFQRDRKKRIEKAERAWAVLSKVRAAMEEARTRSVRPNMPDFAHLKADTVEEMLKHIAEHPEPETHARDAEWLKSFKDNLADYRRKLAEARAPSATRLLARFTKPAPTPTAPGMSQKEKEAVNQAAEKQAQILDTSPAGKAFVDGILQKAGVLNDEVEKQPEIEEAKNAAELKYYEELRTQTTELTNLETKIKDQTATSAEVEGQLDRAGLDSRKDDENRAQAFGMKPLQKGEVATNDDAVRENQRKWQALEAEVIGAQETKEVTKDAKDAMVKLLQTGAKKAKHNLQTLHKRFCDAEDELVDARDGMLAEELLLRTAIANANMDKTEAARIAKANARKQKTALLATNALREEKMETDEQHARRKKWLSDDQRARKGTARKETKVHDDDEEVLPAPAAPVAVSGTADQRQRALETLPQTLQRFFQPRAPAPAPAPPIPAAPPAPPVVSGTADQRQKALETLTQTLQDFFQAPAPAPSIPAAPVAPPAPPAVGGNQQQRQRALQTLTQTLQSFLEPAPAPAAPAAAPVTPTAAPATPPAAAAAAPAAPPARTPQSYKEMAKDLLKERGTPFRQTPLLQAFYTDLKTEAEKKAFMEWWGNTAGAQDEGIDALMGADADADADADATKRKEYVEQLTGFLETRAGQSTPPDASRPAGNPAELYDALFFAEPSPLQFTDAPAAPLGVVARPRGGGVQAAPPVLDIPSRGLRSI